MASRRGPSRRSCRTIVPLGSSVRREGTCRRQLSLQRVPAPRPSAKASTADRRASRRARCDRPDRDRAHLPDRLRRRIPAPLRRRRARFAQLRRRRNTAAPAPRPQGLPRGSAMHRPVQAPRRPRAARSPSSPRLRARMLRHPRACPRRGSRDRTPRRPPGAPPRHARMRRRPSGRRRPTARTPMLLCRRTDTDTSLARAVLLRAPSVRALSTQSTRAGAARRQRECRRSPFGTSARFWTVPFACAPRRNPQLVKEGLLPSRCDLTAHSP